MSTVTTIDKKKTDIIILSVNGRKVEAKRGVTVLQAILDAGIYIPTLCHAPDLPSDGKRLAGPPRGRADAPGRSPPSRGAAPRSATGTSRCDAVSSPAS